MSSGEVLKDMVRNSINFFLSKEQVGQIGIVTLALGIVPMVLMMILAGWQLSDAELDSSLRGTINSNQKGLQSTVALYHVVRSATVRESLREITHEEKPSGGLGDFTSSDPGDYEDFFDNWGDFEDRVESVVNLDDSEYDTTASVDKYDVHVYYPDGPNFAERNEDTWQNTAGRWSVASPKSDHILLRFNLGGSVAQSYSGSTGAGTGGTYGRAP